MRHQRQAGSGGGSTLRYVVLHFSTLFFSVYTSPYILLQETPIPGSYSHRGFVDDLHSQPGTYRFRDTSRVKSASHQRFERMGQQLLPGAYEVPGFVHTLTKKKVTYGFLATERDEGPKIGHGYGDKVRWDTN